MIRRLVTKRVRIAMLVCLVVIMGCSKAWTATDVVGALGLTKRIDPRAAGMSYAVMALADDVYALLSNPAALTYTEHSQLAVGYGRGLVDDSIAQLLYANADDAMDTWALGVMNYNRGKFQYRDFYDQTTTFQAGSDWLLYYTFANRLSYGWRLGWNLKLFHSRFMEYYKATTLAADLGMSFNFGPRVRWDLAISNFGFNLPYNDDPNDHLGWALNNDYGENLPLAAETGLAIKILKSNKPFDGHDLAIAGRIRTEMHQEWMINGGLEYWYHHMVAIRGGYCFGDSIDELSLGASIRWPVANSGPMQIDYALQLSRDLNYQHQIALKMDFQDGSQRDGGAQIVVVQDAYYRSRHKIGFGVGNIYGGSGINYEYMANDALGIFGGLGTPTFILQTPSQPGFAVGTRYYFLGLPKGGIRGRLSAFLSNGWLLSGLISTEYLTADIQIGFQWRVLEWMSLDWDIGYAIALEDRDVIMATDNQLLNNADIGVTIHLP